MVKAEHFEPWSGREDLSGKRRTVVSSLTSDEASGALLEMFSGNKVTTSQNIFLTFLTKNLFLQLHRFPNFYFIFLAALNFVPVVNAFQPGFRVFPILAVLLVTAMKDLWEDYRTHKSDRVVNNLVCEIYKG